MFYHGHARHGGIELDEATSLPEGAEAPVRLLSDPAGEEEIPTLYERLGPVIGKATRLPTDAARNQASGRYSNRRHDATVPAT
ncbi:MAG: hypothetical protein HUU22_06160 [Phycisphaerae bacterium]|nr:hypothetical protein [Phycisphaerae bacterium]NUQ45598.1 hypothetical protein [Phycisphaerae bacterium]